MPDESLDEEREHRIAMQIVVDAYGPEEQAVGWYYYLENTLKFPFSAWYIERRPRTGLDTKLEVQVLSLADLEECEAEIYVLLDWEGDALPVPLRQLEPSTTNERTKGSRGRLALLGGPGVQLRVMCAPARTAIPGNSNRVQ